MQRYNNAINWHMPLLVNLDNYFFQLSALLSQYHQCLLQVTVTIIMLWESSLLWFVSECCWIVCGASNWNKIAVSGSDQIHRNSYDMIIQKYLVVEVSKQDLQTLMTHEVIFSQQPSRWCCDESGINSEKYFVQIIVLFFEKQLVLLL